MAKYSKIRDINLLIYWLCMKGICQFSMYDGWYRYHVMLENSSGWTIVHQDARPFQHLSYLKYV